MLQDLWTANGACNVLSALKIWESERKPYWESENGCKVTCRAKRAGAAAAAAGRQPGARRNAVPRGRRRGGGAHPARSRGTGAKPCAFRVLGAVRGCVGICQRRFLSSDMCRLMQVAGLMVMRAWRARLKAALSPARFEW